MTATSPSPPGESSLGEPPPGFQALLGFELADWRPGEAEVVLQPQARHMNRGGAPHGGVIATLIDVAGGYAGCHCPHPGRVISAQTVSLSVSFLGRARGGILRARGRRIGGGRRIFFARVEISGDDGTLVASGEASYAYRHGYAPPDGGPMAELLARRDE